jgi:hypothetical protein
MTLVRTSENQPATLAFSVKPPTIGGTRVRSQSGRMQTNKATAETKKTCKYGPFAKRLMGFEPTTFCMASRTRGDADWPDLPANERLSLAQWAADFPRFST